MNITFIEKIGEILVSLYKIRWEWADKFEDLLEVNIVQAHSRGLVGSNQCNTS